MASLSNSGLNFLLLHLTFMILFAYFMNLTLSSFCRINIVCRFLLLSCLYHPLHQTNDGNHTLYSGAPKNIFENWTKLQMFYVRASLVPVLQINVDGIIISYGKFKSVKKFIQDPNFSLSAFRASATNINHIAWRWLLDLTMGLVP